MKDWEEIRIEYTIPDRKPGDPWPSVTWFRCHGPSFLFNLGFEEDRLDATFKGRIFDLLMIGWERAGKAGLLDDLIFYDEEFKKVLNLLR